MTEACTQGVDTGFVTLGYTKVAVLGVVQGITELLTILSPEHIAFIASDIPPKSSIAMPACFSNFESNTPVNPAASAALSA